MDEADTPKNVEEWLLELNDPRVTQRQAALNALADSGTLDNTLVHELKLIARGDPDGKTRSLARILLKSRGIKIVPQIEFQPGVKERKAFWSREFWLVFLLWPILNFIGLYLLRKNLSILLAVNLALLVYFSLTRKNVALGIVVAFGFFVVIVPICLIFYLSQSCFPDGCGPR
jgi:hypothetical protein